MGFGRAPDAAPLPRQRAAHAAALKIAARFFAAVFALLTVDVLGDARGLLDERLMDAIRPRGAACWGASTTRRGGAPPTFISRW